MSCSWCHFAAVQNGQSAKTVAGYDVKRLSSLAGLLDRSDFDGILPMRMLPMRRNPSDPLLLDRFGQTSCATQARQVEENDSLTVNELAGYFDDFLYLPKSMSIMAEGMYA